MLGIVHFWYKTYYTYIKWQMYVLKVTYAQHTYIGILAGGKPQKTQTSYIAIWIEIMAGSFFESFCCIKSWKRKLMVANSFSKRFKGI